MRERLKEITYLTMKNLKNNDIILPGDYSKIFAKIAKDLDMDILDDNIMSKEIEYCNLHINNIVEKTSESLTQIHSSTQKAQTAILNKDGKSLEEINQELLKMRNQINFLQKELFSDTLTGTYNRKWFSDFYLKEDKFPENGKVAFLDLNKFKNINDTYGHLVGDQVLKYLVKFLKMKLNSPSINFVRYAGDEFLILFGEEILDQMDIEDKMNDVQIKLSKQKLKSSKIDNLQFSFSFGMLDFKKSDDASDILAQADSLMYENKQKNR
jgi:diguanylate cyclase